jgi:hypothetical protein
MRQQGNLVRRPRVVLGALVLLQCAVLLPGGGEATCETGCDTAYAFYRIQSGEDLVSIGNKFQTSQESIQAVNPKITNINFILNGDWIYIPFKCDCLNGQLSHIFFYQVHSFNPLSAMFSHVVTSLKIV